MGSVMQAFTAVRSEIAAAWWLHRVTSGQTRAFFRGVPRSESEGEEEEEEEMASDRDRR